MKRLIMTGYFANICEWYDFCVFAFLLKPLSQLFGLTQHGEYQGTLIFFALFAVSYIARPIGSVILGYLGDKYSPAKIYKYCLIFMALPSLLISFLPTYETISSISITIIFIGLRIIQGFFTGGELPLSGCYLYGEGSTKTRPLLCSFVTSSSILGVFIASIVVYILNKSFTSSQMLAYGWRIPFSLGAIIFIAIYTLQRNLIESTISISKSTKISTSLKALLSLRGLALFLIITFLQFGFYLFFIWLPNSPLLQHFFPFATHFLLTSILLVILSVSIVLVGGILTKFFSNKMIVTFSYISVTLLAFLLFNKIDSKSSFILLLILVTICFAGIEGVIIHIICSQFELRTRAFCTSIIFSLSTTLFGATAPLIVTYFSHTYGFISLAYFILLLTIIGLVALFLIKEPSSIQHN